MTYELPGRILGKSLGGVVRGTLEKENEKSLEKLKGILEK